MIAIKDKLGTIPGKVQMKTNHFRLNPNAQALAELQARRQCRELADPGDIQIATARVRHGFKRQARHDRFNEIVLAMA